MNAKNCKKNAIKFLALRRIQRLSKCLRWTSYEKDMGCGRNGKKKKFWKNDDVSMSRVSTRECHVSIADVSTGHVSASHSSTSVADVSRGSDFLPRQRHVAPRGNIPFAGAAPAQPQRQRRVPFSSTWP